MKQKVFKVNNGQQTIEKNNKTIIPIFGTYLFWEPVTVVPFFENFSQNLRSIFVFRIFYLKRELNQKGSLLVRNYGTIFTFRFD